MDESSLVYEQRLCKGGELMLREAGAYFARAGALHVTLQRLELPLSFENALDPSVQAKYIELWEQAHGSRQGSPYE